MKRVLVIGCPGGGKSTFSRQLNQLTKLPLYHLDMLYWNEDRTTVPKKVFLERLAGVIAQDEWIIDGNYSSTMEMRLEACDTVFFLDYPTQVCLEGIAARKGKARADIPWVEEADDEEFLQFVCKFQEESRPEIIRLLDKYPAKQLIVFRSREEAGDYLNACRQIWLETDDALC